MYQRILVVVLATFALTVLTGTYAGAAALHNTDIRNFDFSEVDRNPCTGHEVEFSGTFQVVDQFTANENVVTFHTSTTFKGVSGVDLVTGERLHWITTASANDGFFLEGDKFQTAGTLTS